MHSRRVQCILARNHMRLCEARHRHRWRASDPGTQRISRNPPRGMQQQRTLYSRMCVDVWHSLSSGSRPWIPILRAASVGSS